jgi:type IV pilus assembly protein PilQ
VNSNKKKEGFTLLGKVLLFSLFCFLLVLNISSTNNLSAQESSNPENLITNNSELNYDVEIIGLDENLPSADIETAVPVQEAAPVSAPEVKISEEALTPQDIEALTAEPLAESATSQQPEAVAVAPKVEEKAKQPEVSAQSAQAAEAPVTPPVTKVSLDFKEADIRNVLRILSYKSGINIVAAPEVTGVVTIRLTDVPWDKALDVILSTYGFGFERKENIISVYPMEMLTSRKKEEAALAEVQPTVTKVVSLKFTDAQDMKKALDPQLSPRGKITVLSQTGTAGWEFAGADLGKRKRVGEKQTKSRILIISDIPPVLEKLEQVISRIDRRPQQILIEARILEVNRDKLRDLGVEFGTGADAASFITTSKKSDGDAATQLKAQSQAISVAPSTFSPIATSIAGVSPFNSGITAYFKKVTGNQFEVILHALQEDVHTNVLSAPRILTLSDQEASILVGQKWPILSSEVGTEAGATVVTSLDYYQDLGIQLNVVPQVNDEGYINLIIHPAITSKTAEVGTNRYPVIDTRETETQVLIKDGETIVIGGLLKDIKGEAEYGIPFLKDIPIIGWFFKRKSNDVQKLDLIIFITATIVKSDEDFVTLRQNMDSPVRSILPENSQVASPAEVQKPVTVENPKAVQ